MLCSNCFIKLFQNRLSSDYLPDHDYSDYLVDQFQDIQDVCSTSVGPVSTRYWAGYLPATVTSNDTTSATATTGSSPSSSAATTTTPAVVTPNPIQTSVVSNCNTFYKAVSGDSCYSIATNASVPLSDFEAWNPAVGSDCTTLSAGYYYCIGIPLATASSACQMVDFSYGVTTKYASAACDQISLQWNVTTGDFSAYTGDVGCYSDIPLCLPPPCTLAQISNSSTCDSLAASFSTATLNVTTQMILSWKPNIIGSCDNLTAQYVCASAPGGSYIPPANPPVDVNGGGQERGGPGGADPTAISGTPSLIVTSGINQNPTAAPDPTQAGLVSIGNVYGKAVSGDSCSSFATNNSITTSQLYSWNPILGASGQNCTSQFWAGYYYCVGAITSPTQAGSIIASCNEYAQALSGGTCSSLAIANGITVAQLGQWNSVLGTNGADCGTQFWSGYYYCIGVAGGSSISPNSTTQVSTTSPIATVAAPSPTQTGIISTCDKYAITKSGDYCSLFATNNGITAAQLYAWNTVLGAAGANCDSEFWSGYYYCVKVSISKMLVRDEDDDIEG